MKQASLSCPTSFVTRAREAQSLVNQLALSQECQDITRAIVSLAKSPYKVVAAEGIATRQEQDLIIIMAFDELQRPQLQLIEGEDAERLGPTIGPV